MLTTVLLSASLISACGKNKDTQNVSELEDDSDVHTAESAVSSLGSAVNDEEQTPDYAARVPKVNPLQEILFSTAHASACGLSRFTPAIAHNADCNGTVENRTVLANFDDCSAGKNGEFILSGQVWLQFDTPATCDSWINGGALPTSGSVVRTTDAFVRNNPGGSYVTVSSNPHQNYKGETVGGGIQTAFTASGRNVDILGVSRKRTRATGRQGFFHSVRTSAPLAIEGTRFSAVRKISSGQVDVDLNYLKVSSSVSFTNLTWDRTCCHPIDGQLEVSSTLSTKKVQIDFNTGECGLAKVTGPNGSQNVELSVCE